MEFVNWELAEAGEQQYLAALEAVADAAQALRAARTKASYALHRKLAKALDDALAALKLAQDAAPSE